MIAELPPVRIMYVASDKGISGSEEAFTKLESRLQSLKARKFYGLIFGTPPEETYWACAAVRDGEQPEAIGLKTDIIPGGRYAIRRIHDWEHHIESIGNVFRDIISSHPFDPSRPCVEFYHGTNYLVVRVPVQ
ncbi:hypothetical protein A2Z33_06000 [Candidatus Gottesmanbacteria bacterium RBG_16_52_11]|uniref:Bacterial transcription activator effector binding domain-containing protein n=1 Tax=Candidatus Gottesmanbacteria bacterium RBG_16_52_11 TaxID=1798374 RepID=A0A1F5YY62_9BACT|nr:MAG: hypothetical protein A2Z33_06000 [Candidatus Gottesmanbacteria bacterium RBG_16_52_11]